MRRTRGCSSSWIRSRVRTQASLMHTQTGLLQKPRGNEEWRVVRTQGCSSSSRCSSMNTRAHLLPLPTTYLHLSRPGPPLSHLTPTPALMHTQRHLTHTYTHTHTHNTHTLPLPRQPPHPPSQHRLRGAAIPRAQHPRTTPLPRTSPPPLNTTLLKTRKTRWRGRYLSS